MKFDKKSLIEHDYKLYLQQYEKIQKDLNSDNHRNDEDLTKENLKNWLDNGVFTRRLKFRKHKENFYITTANIKRGKGQVQEIKFGEDYLYSYWDKQKVEGLLSRTINDYVDDDRLAELDLIGEYHPKKGNLLNVRYETKSGKEFIKNAKNFIDGIEESNIVQRIDIDSFFKLNFELAEQGIQAKALYEKNNCIIEGMAGTGKSTIALQKLKFFYENNNIAQDKMLVIVKNFKLKSYFLTLLEDKNINLEEIKILSLSEIYKDKFSIRDFILLKNISKELLEKINQYIDSRDINSLSSHYYNLFNYIGMDFFKKLLSKKIELLQSSENLIKLSEFSNELEELNKIKILNDEEKERKKSITKEINKINPLRFKKILKSIDGKYQFSITIIDELISLIDFSDVILSNCFTLKWIIEYKNFQINLSKLEQKKKDLILAHDNKSSKKIKDINSELSKIEEQLKRNFPFATRDYITKFKDTMIKVYLNQNYISKILLMNYSDRDKNLIYKYLNLVDREYEIIIIDEAQDFEKEELEYLRLLTNKVFLTGDMLQNLNSDKGLRHWNDILFKEEIFEKDSRLNIFNLKHNYRQTYQLANASFNYRNILLDRDFEDIGDDYFENEKRFGETEYFKPKIFYVKNDDDIYDMVNDNLQNLLNIYTSRFPLVIIVKNLEQKNYYLDLFTDFNLNDSENFKNSDILIYTIDEVKGEQFPIVFADISDFNSKEIYLIMSRAQFELKLFFKSYDKFNKPFHKLMVHNLKLIELDKNIDLNKFVFDRNSKVDNYVNTSNKQVNDREFNDSIIQKEDLESNNEAKKLKDSLKENQGNGETPAFIQAKNNEMIISDEKKHEENISNDNKNIKPEFKTKTYTNNKIQDKENLVKIEEFLYKEYEGHCQICGDTFAYNNKNCFELKSLNFRKNRDVNRKGNTLSLCHKHHAIFNRNLQKNIFIENLQKNEVIDINILRNNFRFHEFVGLENIKEENDAFYRLNEKDEFIRDVYFLPIKLFNKVEYIKFTEAHILEFIVVWNEN